MPQAKDGFKVCSRCKMKLPATNKFFCRSKIIRDGLNYQCKECQKKSREKHKGEKNEWSRNYYQNNKEKLTVKRKKYNQTVNGIYNVIKARTKARNIPLKLIKEDFIEWYEQQKQKCVFCDIPKELLEPLEWGRKKERTRLAIDRKNNSKGYTIDNICLACNVCNRSKNEDISFNEMKQLGKSIKILWQKR